MEMRRADGRGHTNLGWLDSRHSFSFGDYYDGSRLGHRTLRVINDDRVTAGAGFGAHPHRDMEILSYVLDGALEHRDSLGTGSVIGTGEIQHMRAGSGVVHSEFNPSTTAPVHFLQIWIVPGARGLAPSYAQRRVDRERARSESYCWRRRKDATAASRSSRTSACGTCDGAGPVARHKTDPHSERTTWGGHHDDYRRT